jgi:light-regulated signal transduction histidine kinase (bacteriophytochrome)
MPCVQGDRTQLTQLFQNLLANAIKFRGQQSPRIDVSCEKRDQQWVFAVRDNGIGIPPEKFDRIFHLFCRLHAREEYPGTGIGLALSRKIVTRHGGRIWVDSKPGEGSVFFFTLPAG